jgi:hypothetical protein
LLLLGIITFETLLELSLTIKELGPEFVTEINEGSPKEFFSKVSKLPLLPSPGTTVFLTIR